MPPPPLALWVSASLSSLQSSNMPCYSWLGYTQTKSTQDRAMRNTDILRWVNGGGWRWRSVAESHLTLCDPGPAGCSGLKEKMAEEEEVNYPGGKEGRQETRYRRSQVRGPSLSKVSAWPYSAQRKWSPRTGLWIWPAAGDWTPWNKCFNRVLRTEGRLKSYKGEYKVKD